MGMDYKKAGVNLELGNDASQVLYNASRLTWKNRKGMFGEVEELFSDFSGLRGIHVGGLPEGTYMNMNFDGVGTKIEIAERLKRHDTIAYGLFEMVCGDAVIRGAEPVMVGSILDVNSLGTDEKSHIDFVKQLGEGYVKAAEEEGVAVVNGEIAELGARVTGYCPLPGFPTRFRQAMKYLTKGEMPNLPGFNYNWGAGVVWVAKKDRMITGKRVEEGDILIGLKENGPRKNGLSLFRKVFEMAYGREWHEVEYDGKTLGEAVLTPSVVYTKAIVEMFGGYDRDPKVDIHGIAHITGGGIPEKMGRMLKPSGLGADIFDPFDPPKIMLHCQEMGSVTDRKAHRALNMGHGMIIAVAPKNEPKTVIQTAKKYGVEAKVIGKVTGDHEIRIKNKGAFSNSGSTGYLVF